jgi:hypothetical protein
VSHCSALALIHMDQLLETASSVLTHYAFPCVKDFQAEKARRPSLLPPEPESGDPTSMQVLLRLPSGHRLERRFRISDRLQVCCLG